MEYFYYIRSLNSFFSFKKFKNSILFLFGLFSLQCSCEQSDSFHWPENKKAAVCLTYDDALSTHLDIAIPQLDQYDFKGTFFCTGNSKVLQERSDEWLASSMNGHELANHTFFHPCRKIKTGRDTLDWISPDRDLNKYTVTQLVDELKRTNNWLNQLDGKIRRTFAYPCSDYQARGQSYVKAIDSICSAARGEGNIVKNISELDLYQMPGIDVNGKSGKELIELTEQARENETLIIFMFHGVGGDYLEVSNAAHRELLVYLSQHQNDYWIQTFMEITDYLRQ